MSSITSGNAPNPLLEGSILRSLLSIAIPVILSNLLQSGYITVDAFWVGRVGSTAVAAIAVSQPIFFLAFALGIALNVAGSMLVAQFVGAGKHRDASTIASQVLILALIFALPITLLGEIFAPWMLHMLGTQADVFPSALKFLRVILGGIIFTFGFAMLQSLMRAAGEVRIPLFITAGTLLLNAIIDPIFIFGWGVIPAFGVEGAAIATVTNQCLAMLVGFMVLRSGRIGISIRFSDMKPRWDTAKRAMQLGFPASIELCSYALSASGMMYLVTAVGTVATAAFGVVNNVNALVIVPAIGMSMATATLVGQNIGAEQFDRARAITRLSALISFIGLSVIGLLGFIFAPNIIAIFTPDQPRIIEYGAQFLYIMAPSYGLIGLHMALSGAFRASGRTMTTMTLALIAQWLVQLPLAWALFNHTSLGISGLWWAYPLTNLFTAIMTMILFARINWQRTRLIGPQGAAQESAA